MEALQRLAIDGIPARLIQVCLLWIFPTDELLPWLETATPLVVVGLNYSGQLAQLLREKNGRASDYLVVNYNGPPVTEQELSRTFTNIHVGRSTPCVVLRNSYE